MPSAAAPIRLTPASISRGQPSAPSVTNTTATASSPTFTSNLQASGSSKPASLFSSLLSGSTSSKPKPKPRPFNPSSAPSIASSSVSVSVSTSTAARVHSPPASSSSRAATIASTSTTTPSTTSRNTTTTTTTTATHPPTSSQPTSTTTTTAATTLPTHPNLHPPNHPAIPIQPQPTHPQPSEITQARHAILASIGNQLDRELGTRAAQLHANNAAIERQEREVARATAGLARENERLGRLAETHARRVKEIGNVQNWAEMLEREFVILEETLRLVGGGGGGGEGGGSDGEGSGSGSGSEGWSDGSDWEGDGEEDGEGSGGDGDVDGDRNGDGVVERDGEGDVVMGIEQHQPEMVPLPASPPGEQSMIG